jgi:hypothetical protein
MAGIYYRGAGRHRIVVVSGPFCTPAKDLGNGHRLTRAHAGNANAIIGTIYPAAAFWNAVPQ